MTTPDTVGGMPTALRQKCGHDSRSVFGCLNCEAADAIEELCRAAPAGGDVFEAYKTWPKDIRAKLSMHDLRRMGGWAPRTNVGDWRIDTSAGGPILVYQNCSVIESEQARYVLRLIKRDFNDSAPAGGERRSTHHVHRGPESLPCYCAGTSDHPIGQEVAAPAGGDAYHALNRILAVIGADGDIDSRHAAVVDAMEALRGIDGGRYQDSAPAGSGEVEAFCQRLDEVVAEGHDSGFSTIADLFQQAAALLRKLQQGADYVMVPKEPTRAMCLAAQREIAEYPVRDDANSPVVIYRAMIAASQGQDGGNG